MAHFKVELGDKMKIQEAVDAAVGRDGHTVSHQRVGSPGPETVSEAPPDGSIHLRSHGKASQGEGGTARVARLFVEKLNLAGANWSAPEDRSTGAGAAVDDVDAIATDGDKVLQMQITRSTRDIWASFAKKGSVEQNEMPAFFAEAMWKSIEAKASRMPPGRRAPLVLLLDATESPVHSLDRSSDEFRSRYGQRTTQLGFAAVWIVGPVVALVSRLDTA